MLPTCDFSGLVNSVWALASAAAIVPIDSLHRCMTRLLVHKVKADSAGFRAPGPHSVADRLLSVLGHEPLELSLGPLMVQESLPGATEDAGELGPGVR